MSSPNKNDQKRIDEVRNNLYQIFEKKIDKEIIDLVFQHSGYKENVAFDHLQCMAEDFSKNVPEPAPEPEPDPGPEPLPATTHQDCIIVSNSTNVEGIADAAMGLSIQNNRDERQNSPSPSGNIMKRPGNLLEQLSHASVPPADINVVMSSTSVLHQDPAIIQTGPSSPARPRSLFSEITSTPNHGAASPVHSTPTDNLFNTNPYLAPVYHEPNPNPFSLFMQPMYDMQTRRTKNNSSGLEKLIEYINFPSRRILLLMRGLPGSGKTFKAKQLCGVKGVIYSTDDYFKRNMENKYHFDPRFLHDAHMWNQDRARKAIESGISPIFIDNTNMQKWEMKPYIVLALKKNFEVKIIEPTTSWAWNPGKLAKWNSHNVLKSKIENMMERYERFDSIDDILCSNRDIQIENPEIQRRHQACVNVSRTEQPRFSSQLAISPIRRRENLGERTENSFETQQPNPIKVTSTPVSSNTVVQNAHVNSQPKNLFSAEQSVSDTIMEGNVEHVDTGVARNSESNDVVIVADLPSRKRSEDRKNVAENDNNEIDFTLLSINQDVEKNTDDDGYISPPVCNNDIKMRKLSKNDKNCGNDPPVFEIPSDVPEKKKLTTNENVNIYKTADITGRGSIKRNNVCSSNEVVMEKTDDLENEFAGNIEDENTSPGKIAELIESFASAQQDERKKVAASLPINPKGTNLNLIDLTEEDKTLGLQICPSDQIDLNLQFIYECFPDLKKSYCEDWLKRYNGDLVKTCDYLSRLSQVEELPDDPDVPDIEELFPKDAPTVENISLADIFENQNHKQSNQYRSFSKPILTATRSDILCNKEEEADSTLVITPTIQEKIDKILQHPTSQIDLTCDKVDAATSTDFATIDLVETIEDKENEPVGEAFFCDVPGSSNEVAGNGTFAIAIDIKLAKEMVKMFGGGESEDLLHPEDLVLELDKDMGKQIYNAWMGSVKARKRKVQAMLEDDERLAKELQNEENRARRTDGNDTKKKKAKKDKKKIDTHFTNNCDPRLYGGSFEPNNAWKDMEEEAVSLHGKEKLNGRQLELRKELYGMFPGVAEEALNDILAAASYNIDSAAIMIRNSCGLVKNQAIQNVYATDVEGSDWSKVSSPPRKKAHTSAHVEVPGPSNVRALSPLTNGAHNELYQTMTEGNQSYQDFRAEAELHKNLRTEYFQKAAAAFQQKQGLLAQHYADKAREHTLKMNEAHGRAAELTLERKNQQYMKGGQVIDFHGLHADEALRALTNFLQNALRLKHKNVYIITGRGLHSKGSFSTVRNAVMKALNAYNYQYRYHNNGGMLEVFLK